QQVDAICEQPRRQRSESVGDEKARVGRLQVGQCLVATVDRGGVFDGGRFNIEVQHANLVFVDRRLILGLEAGYVVAHLSKFESAFAPKRKDDIASQLSQSANFSGDDVLLDDRQVGEP